MYCTQHLQYILYCKVAFFSFVPGMILMGPILSESLGSFWVSVCGYCTVMLRGEKGVYGVGYGRDESSSLFQRIKIINGRMRREREKKKDLIG